MYEELNKIQFQELKFQATLHGAKVEEPVEVGKKSTSESIFKDSSEYEHMSKEEKDKLTDKMMNQMKLWSSGALKR